MTRLLSFDNFCSDLTLTLLERLKPNQRLLIRSPWAYNFIVKYPSVGQLKIAVRNLKTGTLLRDQLKIEKDHKTQGPSAQWEVELIDFEPDHLTLVLTEAFCFTDQTLQVYITAPFEEGTKEYETRYKVLEQTLDRPGRMITKLEAMVYLTPPEKPSINNLIDDLNQRQEQIQKLVQKLKGYT